MRFVHLADVHLDTPFASRSADVQARLRDATRQALVRAVDLALEERVHAFLVAGDLFDGDRLSFHTEAAVVEQLGRLRDAGIHVVYATGNHDPGAEGYRSLQIAWPEGVQVVADASPRRIEITDPSGRPVGHVTAAGHASARETANLAATFPPAPDSGLPEVAMLHTQLVDSLDVDAHHPYAPSTLDDLRRSGYHYWALGHVHLRQAASEAAPAVHYPGSLQGRTPREEGPRGVLLVDLSDPARPRTEFRSTAPLQWARLTVDALEPCANLDDLVDRVAAAWAGREAPPDAVAAADTLLHLSLTGPCPLWRLLGAEEERRALAGAVRTRLGLLWVDALADAVTPVVDVDRHAGRRDVLGETLRLLGDLQEGRTAVLDLDLDLQSFAWSDVGAALPTEDGLRALLRGGREDVLARMLRAGGAEP